MQNINNIDTIFNTTLPIDFSIKISIILENFSLNAKIENPNAEITVPIIFPRFIIPTTIGSTNSKNKIINITQKHTLMGVLSM